MFCIIELIRRGILNLNPLVTDRFNWQDAELVYKKLFEYDTDMIGCVINWT